MKRAMLFQKVVVKIFEATLLRIRCLLHLTCLRMCTTCEISHSKLLILVNSICDVLHALHEELSRRAEPMELQRLDRETVRMSCVVLDMFTVNMPDSSTMSH